MEDSRNRDVLVVSAESGALLSEHSLHPVQTKNRSGLSEGGGIGSKDWRGESSMAYLTTRDPVIQPGVAMAPSRPAGPAPQAVMHNQVYVPGAFSMK